MSVEKVKAFYEKVAEDEALQKELKALAEREKLLQTELVKIASASGFNFTIEDACKARLEKVRDISDEALGAKIRAECDITLLCGGSSA